MVYCSLFLFRSNSSMFRPPTPSPLPLPLMSSSPSVEVWFLFAAGSPVEDIELDLKYPLGRLIHRLLVGLSSTSCVRMIDS